MENLNTNGQTTMTREQRKIAQLFDWYSSNDELLKWLYYDDNLELFGSLIHKKGSDETITAFCEMFGDLLSTRHQSQVAFFMDNPEELAKLKVPTEEYCKSNNTPCFSVNSTGELDIEALSDLAIATFKRNSKRVGQLELDNNPATLGL